MDELKSLLAKVAPWMAAAAGGPATLAAQAIKTAAEALGASGATAQDVTNALLGATPEQVSALQAADKELELRMKSIGFANIEAMESFASADRANARQLQASTSSNIPALLTCFVVGSFTATLVLLMVFDVPATNRDIVVYMIGQLSGGFTSALAFWLGTTRDSGVKTQLLAKAMPVKTD
jgi:hypothetical protein